MIELITNLTEHSFNRVWRFVRKRTLIGLLIVASQALLIPQSATALDDQADSTDGIATDRALQLESFDAVWDQVRTQYFDYARIESDWLEARETLRPRAAGASVTELRSLLNGMLERVGESHFVVLPPTEIHSSRNDADSDEDDSPLGSDTNLATGLSVLLIEDALIIDRVGEANAGRIEPGWELIAIGDQSLDAVIDNTLNTDDPLARKRAKLILEATANGRIGFPDQNEELVLTLRDAEGEVHTVTAHTEPEAVSIVQIGNLPGLAFSYRTEVRGNAENCVGIMAFTSWVPELMDRFLESRAELFACQSLIIDLRGNLGGVLTTMMPLTSHLVSEVTLLGQLKREDGRIDFRAFPRTVADDGSRIQPFNGSVAILIDSMSASTSEMFTAGMQALGRARVFGTQSPGMALPAQMLPLANGDRLMYAFADYIDGEGRRIEGVGVTPDETIEPSRAALLAGLDPALEAALSWLATARQQDNHP